MFFLLNTPPTLLITKRQRSQTICNSISTDCNRNLTSTCCNVSIHAYYATF